MSDVVVVQAGRFAVPLQPAAVARWWLARVHVPASRAGALRASLPWLPPKGTRARGPDPASALLAETAWALHGTPLESVPIHGIVARDFAGKDRGRRLAILFEPRRSEPSAILKLRSAGAPGPSLLAESEALQRLHARLPAPLRAALPRVIAFVESDGAQALLLTVVQGRSALARIRSSARPQAAAALHVGPALRWLADMHAATRVADGRAAGHGDFWWRNVLASRGGAVAGIVDWERSTPDADVTEDSFTLALSTALDVPPPTIPALERFRRGLVDDTATARALRDGLRAHALRTGIDPGTLRARFVAHLRSRTPSPPHDEAAWRSFADLVETGRPCAFSG